MRKVLALAWLVGCGSGHPFPSGGAGISGQAYMGNNITQYTSLDTEHGQFCHTSVFGPFDGCCQGHGGSGAGPGVCPNPNEWLFTPNDNIVCADGWVPVCEFTDPTLPPPANTQH
jgi:hypothetical protein